MFHVGQFVVCVSDTWRSLCWADVPNKPISGRVYQVRGIYTENWESGTDAALLLEEIVNEPLAWPRGPVRELGFGLHRFRPVKDTSLDVFDIVREPTNLRVREFQDVRA